MANWQYCRIHKKVFYSDQCDLCHPIKDPMPSKEIRIKRSYKKKIKNTIWERFHNYGVKFDAEVQWDHLFKYEQINLKNNVSYKRIDLPDALIRVFKKSILVTLRSSREIVGLKVREAEQRSFELVNKVLDQLPLAIKIKDRSVVNTHNAFVNHPTANHDVNVHVNGEARLISDFSKGHPEFEAVNPDHAVSDSEILEKFNEDLIVNNPDPLSIQGQKINTIVNILDRYATQMELHLSVEQKTSDNLDRIGEALDKIVLIGSGKLGGDSLKTEGSMNPRRSLGVKSPSVHRFRSEKRLR